MCNKRFARRDPFPRIQIAHRGDVPRTWIPSRFEWVPVHRKPPRRVYSSRRYASIRCRCPEGIKGEGLPRGRLVFYRHGSLGDVAASLLAPLIFSTPVTHHENLMTMARPSRRPFPMKIAEDCRRFSSVSQDSVYRPVCCQFKIRRLLANELPYRAD